MTPHHFGSFTVRNADAARLLVDVRTTGLLGAFLDAPRSVSDAARALNEYLDWARYRGRRLEAAGLLRLDGVQRRKGRAMKLYRAVADVFFVPFEVTRFESLDGYLEGV